jgi:hypothetical protein
VQARVLIVSVVVGMLWLGGATFLPLTGQRAAGRVYSVAQLHAQIERDPTAWVGRTVRVRGWIPGCPGILSLAGPAACQGSPPLLADSSAPMSAPLSVAMGAPDPLLAVLRRVPLLGEHVPAPQALRWEANATYRVQLRIAPDTWCRRSPCYQAVLLDAAPGAG